MKRYQLPITADYVQNWNLWSAIRELLQNSIDAKTDDSSREILFDHQNGTVRVGNTGTKLDIDTLLLGKSSKRDHEQYVGQFGEGYKLAALVLLRLDKTVHLKNGNEFWVFSMAESEQFPGNEVLTIDVFDMPEPCPRCDGDPDCLICHGYGKTPDPTALDGKSWDVCFVIGPVDENEWDDLKGYWLPDAEENARVANAAPGVIYVKGLYVCKLDNMQFAYNFSPGGIRLERDRQLASEYSVASMTASILANERALGAQLLDMVESDKLDTYYISSYIGHSPARQSLLDAYKSRYGDAIPVSNNEEAQECVGQGIPFRIVSERVKNIIRQLANWALPKKKGPQHLLRAWYEDNQDNILDIHNAKKDFLKILELSAKWSGPINL